MLISDIVNEVIREVGGDITDTGLQDNAFGYLKSALRRFPQNVRTRSIISKIPLTLAANAGTLQVPSGFMEERAIWYEVDGKRRNIHIIRDLFKFNALYRGTSYGDPEYCRFYGTTIEFDRLADRVYSCFLEYFKEIDGVLIGDTWAYDSSMAEILKDGMKFYYYTYAEDESKMATFASLFTSTLLSLENKFQREEMPDHVEELSDM